MTLWPSGLRRWLKAPFRKGVGSNPTGVTFGWTDMRRVQASDKTTANYQSSVISISCCIGFHIAQVAQPRHATDSEDAPKRSVAWAGGLDLSASADGPVKNA